jgi:DNA-binding response OmpR family regulator
VSVDLVDRSAERAGRPLDLSAKELALLICFLRYPGRLLTRSELYERVWKEPFNAESNTLGVHIMELRRKLEACGNRLIHTVRGRGYVFGGSPATDSEGLR